VIDALSVTKEALLFAHMIVGDGGPVGDAAHASGHVILGHRGLLSFCTLRRVRPAKIGSLTRGAVAGAGEP
jgi:hypothetical protein